MLKNLNCYKLNCRRLHAEAVYCMFKAAEDTYENAHNTIEELKKLNFVPNLSGLYANISALYFIRSEYDEVHFI